MKIKKTNKKLNNKRMITSELPGIHSESPDQMRKKLGGSLGRQMFDLGLKELQSGHLNQASNDFMEAKTDFANSGSTFLAQESSDMMSGVSAEILAHSHSGHTQANFQVQSSESFLDASEIQGGIHTNTISGIATTQYSVARSELLSLASSDQTEGHYLMAAQDYSTMRSLDSQFGHSNLSQQDHELSQAEQYMHLAVNSGDVQTSAIDFDKAALHFAVGGDGTSSSMARTDAAQSWEAASEHSGISYSQAATDLQMAAVDWGILNHINKQNTDLLKAGNDWDLDGQEKESAGHFNTAIFDFQNAAHDFAQSNHTHLVMKEQGNIDIASGTILESQGDFVDAAKQFGQAAKMYTRAGGGASWSQNPYTQDVVLSYDMEAKMYEQANMNEQAGQAFMKEGHIESQIGNYGTAALLFGNAATEFTSAGDISNEADALKNEGNATYSMPGNNKEAAISDWTQAQDLLEQLGQQALKAGDTIQALSFFEQARTLDRESLSKLTANSQTSGSLEAALAGADGDIATVYETESDWKDAAKFRMKEGADYSTAAGIENTDGNTADSKTFYTDSASAYGYGAGNGAGSAAGDFYQDGDYQDQIAALNLGLAAYENAQKE